MNLQNPECRARSGERAVQNPECGVFNLPPPALRIPTPTFRLPPSDSSAPHSDFRAVVIGGSAGGVEALAVIISALPADFALPILVVQHLHQSDNGAFATHIALMTHLPVIEPCDKERIECGHVYTAPANYHMLANRDWTISLSVDEKVNWSRPSIDVLFESAALVWGKAAIAILLSGANSDGAKGMSAIRKAGGLTIAQTPASAEFPIMPKSAIDAGVVDQVLSLADIARHLVGLGVKEKQRRHAG